MSLLGRNVTNLHAAVEEATALKDPSAVVMGVECEVTEHKSVQNAVAETISAFGTHLTGLVNAAGVLIPGATQVTTVGLITAILLNCLNFS